MTEEKKITYYMRKKMYGGRGAFARAMDYIALRALTLIAFYLLYLPRFEGRATAMLLSLITLALFMLILHVANDIRYAAFYKQEVLRVRKRLLQDRLLMLDMQTAIPLVSALCPPGATPVILQRALPIDANQLLALLRTHQACGELHVFTCSAYDATARAFAQRARGMLSLHAPEELLTAAIQTNMLPGEADAIRSILAEASLQRREKRRKPMRVFMAAGVRKYALLSLLLTGLSFATDYTLYYRLLAGFCMTIAAFGLWRQNARTNQ